ncbi:hypothetical protein [Streptomyces sp. NPDC058665]|uniref:hypothetical protein n=1 Tax=Streptomyces sp. NPDC058665 TaxID=3346586 RepID=UPI00365F46F0
MTTPSLVGIAGLPPLRDDVLYDAEQAGLYIGRTAIWMQRAARADQIPARRVGRVWKWSAANIRSIVAGEHVPQRRKRARSSA